MATLDFKSEEQSQLQLVEREEINNEGELFEAIDKLISHGINVGDVNKLQDAGIYTCNGLIMQTKKSLTGIKGLSVAKVDKICEAAEKIVNFGYITGSDALSHESISELNLPKTCKISFRNGKDDLMNFEVTIRPGEGYYMNGTFMFSFQISPIYPNKALKVKCKMKVYHLNIDLEGNVCLNILREDWKPVLSINTMIYGLFHLFTDPLNPDAAAILRDNPKLFESNVKKAMAGGYVGQTFFPRDCLI